MGETVAQQAQGNKHSDWQAQYGWEVPALPRRQPSIARVRRRDCNAGACARGDDRRAYRLDGRLRRRPRQGLTLGRARDYSAERGPAAGRRPRLVLELRQ